MHHEIPTQWTHHQEELEQGSQKQQISSQEETGTNNMWGEAEKEDTLEDPSKKTDKGKSSHVSSVGNLVTSHGIVDRNAITTKGQQAPPETIKTLLALNKLDKKKAPSGWSTTEA
jgi:hypothetical protein